jgi:hypothetical protein
MNVSDLTTLVAAATRFCEAAQISATAKANLARVCESLEPFRSMEMTAFAELVQQAKQYRDTGILPVPSSPKKSAARKTAKPSPEEAAQRVEHLIGQLNLLYEKVHEESVGFGAIDEICDAVNALSAADAKAVAVGFEITLPSKATKPKSVSEIKRKLTEQKGSAQRIAPIGGT